MLADALRFLLCPHCGDGLRLDGRVVRCASGHAFDVARQGYVSLLPGDPRPRTGDSASMVQARAAFLDAGHYDPIVRAVAAAAAEAAEGAASTGETCVADVGAGTGHYLAAALDRLPEACGVALDASKHALRRAARAHPRIAAAACDAWGPLPLRTASAAVVLDILAPRNPPELHRILEPTGTLIVVTPTERHLAELIGRLGLLHVDPRKHERLAEQLGPCFEQADERSVEWAMTLAHRDVAHLVGMGPSAWHTDDAQLAERIAAMAEPIAVTASFTVARHHPRRAASAGA